MIVEAMQASAYLLSPFDTTVRLSADLLAFITPNEFHPLWGQAAAAERGLHQQHLREDGLRGYIPLALAGYALWGRRRLGRSGLPVAWFSLSYLWDPICISRGERHLSRFPIWRCIISCPSSGSLAPSAASM